MRKGEKMSQEQRQKISLAQKGKPKSEEFREKCRQRMKGKSFFKGHKQSEKQKAMMRERRGEKHYNWGKGINARHGQARNGKRTSEYNCWLALRDRCNNPKNRSYHNYGGRGICVCERWNKFENFLADMGKRPNGLSIDRINNDGNYELNNCRWATRQEQYKNTRLKRDIKGKFKRTA